MGKIKKKGASFLGGKKYANSRKSDGLEPDYNIGHTSDVSACILIVGERITDGKTAQPH